MLYRSFLFRQPYRRARLATVVVAVLLTIYKDKIWKPLPSAAENIELTQREQAPEQGELRYSAS